MPIQKQLFTSNKKDWTTPALILDRVRKVWPIGLDPCHGPGSIVGARLTITAKQDGLVNDWPRIRANEGVFINWPYGNKENKAWARKVVVQLETHPEQILLVAARTSEIWLQDVVLPAKPTAIGFCHKRLKFSNAKHVATFPSMVVYFGKQLDKVVKAFEDICWIVPRPKRGTYPLGIHRTVKPGRKPRMVATPAVDGASKTKKAAAKPLRKKAAVAVKPAQAKAVKKMLTPAKVKAEPLATAKKLAAVVPVRLPVAPLRLPQPPSVIAPTAVPGGPVRFGRTRLVPAQ